MRASKSGSNLYMACTCKLRTQFISTGLCFICCHAYRLVYSLFTLGGPETEANSTGVQLLGILVANKMPAFEPATAVSIEEKK